MNNGWNRREALGAISAGATVAIGPGASAAVGRAGIGGGRLEVEWLRDPVGIDSLRPRFTWDIHAADGTRAVRQNAYRVILASSLASLARGVGDIWDSGRVVDGLGRARPAQPLRLASHTDYCWAVMLWDQRARSGGWSVPARFVTGIVDPADWQARWIAGGPDLPPPPPHARGFSRELAGDTQLPLFRRAFTAATVPERAIVSLVGLGQYELRVNGQGVTDSILNPGWSDYSKTVLYDSYDITRYVRIGENVLGVILGNGMYNVEHKPGRYTKFVDSFGPPKLLLQLSLHFRDGRVEHVASDGSWQTAPGPILFSSIYGGEDVDARLEPAGWDAPGTVEGLWSPVSEVAGPGGRLLASGIPPVVVANTLAPVRITQPKRGVYVYDFGENFAMRPVLVAKGEAGARVTLKPGETLDSQGLVTQSSFAAAPDRAVSFSYTLAGRGEERFVPRFTYIGSRYIELTGAVPSGHEGDRSLPIAISMQSQFVHSGIDQVGDFDSSDELLVRIHHLIRQALLSNTVSVLTDCPHREKLGWLEQTYLNAATVFCNEDAITLYEKMVRDIADAQQIDGMVPGIAPEYIAFVNSDGSDMIWRNSPEWGIAAVLSPWAAFRSYGDTQVLARAYPAMARYLAYLASRANDHILDFGMGDWYDIGPNPPGPSQLTSRALTGTLVYYQGLEACSQIAALLGRSAAESARYGAHAAEVARAFNARFLKGDGLYDTASQTAQAMPLALNVVPPGQRAAALARLVRAIRATGYGVTAGDVGFHYVVEALAKGWRNDVVFEMMSVTDRPSYGYQLAHGATALAEAWDADPRHSLDHFMLGHGDGWLYRSLAGIRVDFGTSVPDEIITLAPNPVGHIRSASATYHSVLGQIACSWTRKDSAIAIDATIPAGSVATVRVPTSRPEAVQEHSRPAARAPGVRSSRAVAGGLELVAGSGRYRFLAPL